MKKHSENVWRQCLRFLACLPVYFYRWFVSPIMPPCCRYVPSCSVYALEAIETHGSWSGGILTIRRLCRCHPWGGSGFDPVPPQIIPGSSQQKQEK